MPLDKSCIETDAYPVTAPMVASLGGPGDKLLERMQRDAVRMGADDLRASTGFGPNARGGARHLAFDILSTESSDHGGPAR